MRVNEKPEKFCAMAPRTPATPPPWGAYIDPPWSASRSYTQVN